MLLGECQREIINGSNCNTNEPITLEKSRLDWFFSQIFPIRNFHDLLSNYDVMYLREVCQDWKLTIDSFLETANDINEPDYTSYKSILRSPSILAYQHRHDLQEIFLEPNLDHSTNVDAFLRGAERHPRNPFLTRRAYLHFMFDEGNCFWINLWSILDLFGDELRSMKFFYGSDLTSVEMVTIVKDCLERTPQLNTLDCSFVNVNYKEDGRTQFPLPVFPPISNLTRLALSFTKWPIYQPFTPFFEQLVSLNVRQSEDFMDWFDPKIHSTFPRLQHFAMCINSTTALSKIHFLTSQLRELDIVSKLLNFCPSIYFYYAEYFKATLCAVKIHQKYKCDSPIKTLEALGLPERTQLDLPHLRTLSLNIMDCGYGPVDVLLKLTQPPEFLEVVVVKLPGCQDNTHVVDDSQGWELLQIHECCEQMYESNVWDLVPSLQEIHVREGPIPDPEKVYGGNYTREMYEYMQRDGNPKAKKRPRGRFD